MNVTVWMWISVLFSCGGLDDGGEAVSFEELLPLTGKLPLPQNGFSNAYADLDGTMWFCSNGGGVFHLDGRVIYALYRKDGLSSDQVFSVISDHHNNLWFGTQNGLTKYDRTELEQIPASIQRYIWCLAGSGLSTISPNAVHSLGCWIWVTCGSTIVAEHIGMMEKEFRSFFS